MSRSAGAISSSVGLKLQAKLSSRGKEGSMASGLIATTRIVFKCALVFVALLLGVTKLTSLGAQDAHDLWVRQFENNYAPLLNESLARSRVPLRLSHEALRLGVGCTEVACGLALVAGSQMAALALTTLLAALCGTMYYSDPSDMAGLVFPAVMTGMCAFVALTSGKKKR